jgi:DNA topoisomerase-1
MSKKLVIVESPAKARTIGRFLGSDYVVEASIGHIRDLPPNKKGLPKELQSKWWADYAVDVDEGFEPFYEVPPEKQKQVAKLKSALKGAIELVLATDEDREGESISWHLLQVLKPPKNLPVRRIAFHEITRDAIQEALKNPRPIDERLVEAQEARRILDRLYGYTLSPVLWRLVTGDLSAGRVQSPAVKLIVEREKRRRDFVISVYWDLKAELEAEGKRFEAVLKAIDGQNLASGQDFDELTGQLKNRRALLLEEGQAQTLADTGRQAKPWKVSLLEKKPGQERPPAPFRTTTLQQEANRKFGFGADRTMRVAQDLYEGIEVRGESVGLITYMRTDSLTLAEDALRHIREEVQKRFGKEFLPDKAVRYESKVANAQEAHEAIRPTDITLAPDSIRRELESRSADHFKLYDLIYKRTLACQMKPAEVLRTTLEVEAEVQGAKLTFGASGKEIKFPGFLSAYVEDEDDPEAALEGRERILPELKVGQEVSLLDLGAARHETKLPARYTEATLIKALEGLGIGRPSTYASIMSVIVDRGYVRRKSKELVPTFTAFMAIEVLDSHFKEFMDLGFTAQMDETLDEIARGKGDSETYLRRFFLGSEGWIGLRDAVNERRLKIPFPSYEIGRHPETEEAIVVRIGKNGDPFLQLGEASQKKFASVPEDLAPADLKLEKALELFEAKRPEAEVVGRHPETGRNLLLRKRMGYYLEVERTPEEIEKKIKPTWVSLPPGADPRELSQDEISMLCQLPRTIGKDPDSGEPIVFRIARNGPVIQCGREFRDVDDWRQGLSLTLEEALALLRTPKGERAKRKAMEPIQDFGALEGAEGPVKVMSGRFGPYVTDGTTNATLPKAMDPAAVTPEQAVELLQKKKAAGPSKGRRKFARRKK